MQLKQCLVDEGSPFAGRSILEIGIRNLYHCLVVGVESVDDASLHTPDVHAPLRTGDVIWTVGEEENLDCLFQAAACPQKTDEDEELT